MAKQQIYGLRRRREWVCLPKKVRNSKSLPRQYGEIIWMPWLRFLPKQSEAWTTSSLDVAHERKKMIWNILMVNVEIVAIRPSQQTNA